MLSLSKEYDPDSIIYKPQTNLTMNSVNAIIQRWFERQYNLYGKLKKEDINSLDYESLKTGQRLHSFYF
jgi:hypothetical protein